MTIFPTRKTQLKTKLSRQEVISKLEHNDIYFPNTDFELQKFQGHFILMSVNQDTHIPKAETFRAKIVINPEENGSTVKLKYYPDSARAALDLAVLIILMIIQAVLIIAAVYNSFLSPAVFIPIIIAPLYYLLQYMFFSASVVSLEKQIEETIEAEIHKLTKDEMSKLQKWYEKKR